jgi:glyceraldehyde 3-phosphate dehydrogenase
VENFGINGFGRIGRTAFRVWWERARDQANLAAINTSGSMEIEDWAYLIKYDSNYGTFKEEVGVERLQKAKEATPENAVIGYLHIGGRKIAVTVGRDPALIPWHAFGVKVVIESTGAFTDAEKAGLHLQGGAQKVIISAPAKGEGVDMSVLGVNDFSPESQIISNASCTTNCVAPVIKVMSEVFGIKKAMLNTVHSYTDDQNLQDNSQRDMRRSRAAALNIVPTTTGAATAVGEIFSPVKGIFDGVSFRVPSSTGSVSDIVMLLERNTTIEEVNQALIEATGRPEMQGILTCTNDPIVSKDIVGRSDSSIVDLALTNVIDGDLVRVVAWYDNEFGYCCRLIDQTVRACNV